MSDTITKKPPEKWADPRIYENLGPAEKWRNYYRILRKCKVQGRKWKPGEILRARRIYESPDLAISAVKRNPNDISKVGINGKPPCAHYLGPQREE